METNNVSADLVWQIVNGSSSLLVKRKEGGGVRFSRDPLNLMNKHSFKYEGFVNDQAIGVNSTPNGKVVLSTKNPSEAHHPSKAVFNKSFKRGAAPRKIYRAIASSTAKKGYRPDLRGAAIARASRIKYSQNPKKVAPVRKSRSAKARKAAAVAATS